MIRYKKAAIYAAFWIVLNCPGVFVVEQKGFEPSTPTLRT